MVFNLTSLESRLLLIVVASPINPEEWENALQHALADRKAQDSSFLGILVDTSQFQSSLSQQDIDNLQQLLLELCEFGPIAVFGMARPLESLLKLSLSGYDSRNFPLYFVENQAEGTAVLHRLEGVNSFATSSSSVDRSTASSKSAFRNPQTEQMFRAFTGNPSLYHEWRTRVDGLYEAGEIAFETVMFAKLHEFGDADDLAIDWDTIIMTLLYDLDL